VCSSARHTIGIGIIIIIISIGCISISINDDIIIVAVSFNVVHVLRCVIWGCVIFRMPPPPPLLLPILFTVPMAPMMGLLLVISISFLSQTVYFKLIHPLCSRRSRQHRCRRRNAQQAIITINSSLYIIMCFQPRPSPLQISNPKASTFPAGKV
jgi:hypothetical protein